VRFISRDYSSAIESSAQSVFFVGPELVNRRRKCETEEALEPLPTAENGHRSIS
jgi:hypothetical protein